MTEPIEVTPDDMLHALLVAHGGDNAVSDLVRHYGIPLDRVIDVGAVQGLGVELRSDADLGTQVKELASSLPEKLDSVSVPALWPDADPPFDQQSTAMLDAALRLIANNPPDEEGRHWLKLRDVFGGVLLTEGPIQDRFIKALAGADASFEDVAGSYPVYLATDFRVPYRDFLETGRLSERVEEQVVPPGLVRADYSADTVPTRHLLRDDRLNIRPHVEALALLITARDLSPPLAVGLFGDWGSGKSYFMEALREEIERITAEARSSGLAQRDLPVYRNVAHIRFNAWHYVDANLWASLVDNVFANLRIRDDEDKSLVDKRRQLYLERLKKQGAALRQADIERRHVEEKYRLARERLERVREERAKQIEAIEAAKAIAKVNATTRNRINDLAARAGLPGVASKAAELATSVSETRAALRRASAMGNSLQMRYGPRAFWIVMLFLLAGPVAGIIAARVDLSVIQQWASFLGTTIVGVTAALRRSTKWTTDTLNELERLDEALQLQIEADPAVTAAREDYEKAEKQRDQIADQVDTLMSEMRQIEEALDGLTPASLLAEFIQGRIGSDDYRKHLGLASLIRHDFETLARHVQEYNDSLAEPPLEKTRESEQEQSDEERYHVNRIVLYIDDLDRCPPQQVVQVLQAVHLLLAFKLFVVVVAVDARWLAQSLRSHYEELLSGGRDTEELASVARVAGPHDYLEKIFQVPFWLRPLDPGAQSLLLSSMAGEMPPADDQVLMDSTGNGAPPETIDTDGQGSPETEDADQEPPEAADTEAAGVNDETEPRPYDFNPELIQIESAERQFMEELRPLLGRSPRSVKRFVNVYRLVKAVGHSTGATLESEAERTEHEVALFLLAIVTGMPGVSASLFRELRARSLSDDQARLAQAIDSAQHTDTQTGAGSNRASEQGAPESVHPDHTAQWKRLNQWLDQRPQWKDASIEGWSVLIERIARYSYRLED